MKIGTEDIEITQKAMLELAIKSGRRLLHDFDHLLSELPKDHFFKEDFKERSQMWHTVFYPDDGMKNYLTELHYQIRRLDVENSTLKERLEKHNLDSSGDDLPF